MISIFGFIVLVNVSCSAYKFSKFYNTTENILCRDCGLEILNVDAITSKLSSASIYTFNDTIFNAKEVVVQVLIKDIFFRYPVITSSDSSCIGRGDWEDDDIWFPNHVMRPCFCSDCGAFVGWAYQDDYPSEIHSNNKFFALILTSLIGDNFLNSLITYPDSSA